MCTSDKHNNNDFDDDKQFVFRLISTVCFVKTVSLVKPDIKKMPDHRIITHACNCAICKVKL